MKKGRCMFTHLWAGLAGGGVCFAILWHGRDLSSEAGSSGHPLAASLSRQEIVRQALEQQIAGMRMQDSEYRQRARRSPQEVAADWTRDRPVRERERAARLARIRSLAASWQNAPDLRQPLEEALMAGIHGGPPTEKDQDALAALFLEWHRRDPAGAYAELARREGWANALVLAPLAAVDLPASEFIAQYQTPFAGKEFIQQLARCQGGALGLKGDTENLAASFAACPPDTREDLVRQFCFYWDEDRPEEAAAYVRDRMPPELKSVFLEEYARSSPDPSSPFALAIGGLVPGGLQIPGVDFSGITEQSDPPDFRQIAPELARNMLLNNLMPDCFYGQRDYQTLLGEHRMSIDDVREEIVASYPGIDTQPAALDVAIFRHFFSADPAAMVAWASPRVPPEDLLALAKSISRSGESATNGRLALNDLQALSQIPGVEASPFLQHIRDKEVAFWRKINPEALSDAAQTLPPSVRDAVLAPPSGP